MKKIVLGFVFSLICSFTIFAKDGNEIIGKYKSSEGAMLEITNTDFTISGLTQPLVMGQTSSSNMRLETALGSLTYYIKPCFVYNDKKITLTNIWLQYPGNDMLAVYIFTYDITTKKLYLTSWDVFTVEIWGATTTEFDKI